MNVISKILPKLLGPFCRNWVVHLELSAQAHTRTCRRQLGRVFPGIYGCVCYEILLALGNLFLIYEIKDNTIVSYWVILLLTAVQNICLHR